MLGSRFLWQVWGVLGLTLVISTGAFSFFVVDQVERDAYLRVEHSLRQQADALAASLAPLLDAGQPVSQAAIARLTPGVAARITLLAEDGRVLADNRQDPLLMDNHLDRDEIRALKAAPLGMARRYSETLGQMMLYLAVPLQAASGRRGYLRLALTVTAIEEQMASLNARIRDAAIAVGLVFLAIGYGVAYRVTNPIAKITRKARRVAKGRYELRLPEGRKDEIGQMAVVINELAAGARQQIDALTENRNRLAAVLAGLAEGVLAFDLERRLLHINDAAIAMLGSGADLDQRYLETDAPRDIRQLVETTVSERTSLSSTVQVAGRTLECASALMQDATGLPTGGILVLEDITERRRLEKVRSDFVANASHELKTPISAIRGLVETIIDDPAMAPEVSRRFTKRIKKQAIRLDRIVQDLMHLSRLDSEGADAQPLARVALAPLLREVLEANLDDAGDAKLSLRLDLQAEALAVEGDAEGLGQMLSNLVDNAIKYTEAGGRVELRLLQAGSMAQIEVQDTGIGISKDQVQRIFERFYRVDRTRSQAKGGTGLGLSIVKHIVGAHKGSVWVDSQLGKGSTFYVRLPLAA